MLLCGLKRQSGRSSTFQIPSLPWNYRARIWFHASSPGLAGGKPWNREEVAILLESRQSGLKFEDIQKQYFPSRTLRALSCKAREIGAPKTQSEKWSHEEDDILRRGVEEGLSSTEISERLRSRTPGAVGDRKYSLELSSTLWTAQENAQLRQLVAKGKPFSEICSKLPHRSTSAMLHRLRTLQHDAPIKAPGLVFEPSLHTAHKKTWIATEVDEAQQMLDSGETIPSIAFKLGRSAYAVLKKIEKSHPTQRTPKRSPSKVQVRAKTGNSWEPDEIQRLRDMFHAGESSASMASALERSRAAVLMKKHSLGIKKKVARLWTSEEDQPLIRALEQGRHWKTVNEEVPQRTNRAIQSRFALLRESLKHKRA